MRKERMGTTARLIALCLCSVALTGCAHGLAPSDDTERTLRLGQAGDMGLVTVKPLQVIEDSRCAKGVQCVWAGRLRLRAEIEPPVAGHERTLTLGEEQEILGGTLLLAEATPWPSAGQPTDPQQYRFVLRYRMPKRD
jgi:hypothetical protein